MKLICANRDAHKEFLTKKSKLLMHLSTKKQPSQIGALDLNGPFSKEIIKMAMKHMKRCSASVSSRDL